MQWLRLSMVAAVLCAAGCGTIGKKAGKQDGGGDLADASGDDSVNRDTAQESASAGGGGGGAGGTGQSTGGTAGSAGAGGQAYCFPIRRGGAGGAGAGSAGAGGGSAGGGGAAGAGVASVVLYANDFEHPNVDLIVDCGNSLDTRGIDFLYGSPSFKYSQTYTVEGVVIRDPSMKYADPSGRGGLYSLGMLSNAQDDHLALTFATTGRPYINVGLDLSSLDVNGCGGPFGVDVPVMEISVYESATPTFDLNALAQAKRLSTGTLTGIAAPDAWTFAWTFGRIALDVSQGTSPYLAVVFDLRASGYAAFDNLSVVASSSAGVVDSNVDGIPDDQQLCPR